jgi:hypothetical protein
MMIVAKFEIAETKVQTDWHLYFDYVPQSSIRILDHWLLSIEAIKELLHGEERLFIVLDCLLEVLCSRAYVSVVLLQVGDLLPLQ